MVSPKVPISSLSGAHSSGFVHAEPIQAIRRREKPSGTRRTKIQTASEIIIVRRIFDGLFYFEGTRIRSVAVFVLLWLDALLFFEEKVGLQKIADVPAVGDLFNSRSCEGELRRSCLDY